MTQLFARAIARAHVLGATALVVSLASGVGALLTSNPDLFTVSLAGGACGILCGLLSRGRRWTLALVVPSLVYLTLVLS